MTVGCRSMKSTTSTMEFSTDTVVNILLPDERVNKDIQFDKMEVGSVVEVETEIGRVKLTKLSGGLLNLDVQTGGVRVEVPSKVFHRINSKESVIVKKDYTILIWLGLLVIIVLFLKRIGIL